MTEREAANVLLLKYWAGRPIPVRPEEIARAEGVTVEQLPTSSELSGEYLLVEGRPTIRYNPAEPPLRQRFTIAHELGHHVMRHGPRYRDTARSMSSTTYDPVEVSANRFAAELLMPPHAIGLLVSDGGVTSVAQLASSFEVSEQAMRFRLRNLGYSS